MLCTDCISFLTILSFPHTVQCHKREWLLLKEVGLCLGFNVLYICVDPEYLSLPTGLEFVQQLKIMVTMTPIDQHWVVPPV